VNLSGILAPAAAVWLGALLVELSANVGVLPTETVVRICLAIACLSLAVAGVVLWRAAHVRQSWILAAIAGGSLGIFAAALHVGALTAEPLQSWVAQQNSVSVVGLVQSEGKVQQSTTSRVWQQAPQFEWRLDTSAFIFRDEQWLIELPITVTSKEPPPEIGSRIRVRGKLSAGRLPETAAVLRTSLQPEVIEVPGIIDRSANSLRAGLRSALVGRPADSASLVAGLAIGDQTQQPQDLKDAMRTAGLSHLTAVSGGNLAILIVLVLGGTRLLRIRLPIQIVLALIAVVWFVILVRPQPSVLRAAVMGSVVLVGMLGGGQRRGTGVLAFSVALLIVVAPELALSWGFALSVGATIGLILWSPGVSLRINQTFPRFPAALSDALAITITAQLATLPILIAMGSSVGLAGVPANLLAMPVVPLITILGLLTALLSVACLPLAVFTGLIASWCASWIANVAFTCSRLPFATVPWPSGWMGAALALLLLLTVAVAHRWLRKHYPIGIPSVLQWSVLGLSIAVVVCIVFATRSQRWLPERWALVACDVGQGDAMVLRTGPSSAMLIDAGLDGQIIDTCLDDLGIAVLDAIVITHFHADHVGGLRGAITGREVKAAFTTSLDEPANEASAAREILAASGLDFQVLRAGDVEVTGEVQWRVLWPSHLIAGGPNNASIVLIADVAGLRFVLPGDIEPAAQAAVMAENPSPAADVAKVPHHGSRYQDPSFASWTGATLSLISVGSGNSYGHPAASTIDNWQVAGAQIARTDQQGGLAVFRQSDGSIGLVTQRG